MNLMLKVGGLAALFVTICKVIVALGIALPVVGFVAGYSSFFYGLAVGIIAASLTRNLWLILLAIAGVFILLTVAGF